MSHYIATFMTVEGLTEMDVGPSHHLNATERGEAEDEALRLPRPDGANFIKLFRDNQYEAPILGFDL